MKSVIEKISIADGQGVDRRNCPICSPKVFSKSRSRFFLSIKALRRVFPRQVRCRSPAGLPGRPTQFPWRADAMRNHRSVAASMCSSIWAAHPSRGHLQPSSSFFCGWQSHFSLVRLRSQQRTEVADSVDKFLRRFLLHLLPKGFVRIRNFGFLANRRLATLLPLCFHLLGSPQQTTS